VLAAAKRNCTLEQAPAEWQMHWWVTGSMPAGKYARAAFAQPSLWTSADKSIAPRESLHTLLDAHVPAGNTHPGDAAADPSLKAIGTLLKSRHAPSTHPLARSANASDRAAAEALAYVRLDEAKPPFKAQVFTLAGQRRC
jgi:molybdate transport system substrate-binding protein